MSSPAILQGGYVLPLSRSFTQLLLDIVAQNRLIVTPSPD